MRTNIELDEKLIAEALRLSRLKSKKAVVHYALAELVRKKKRKGLLRLEGRVGWVGRLEELRKSRT